MSASTLICFLHFLSPSFFPPLPSLLFPFLPPSFPLPSSLFSSSSSLFFLPPSLLFHFPKSALLLYSVNLVIVWLDVVSFSLLLLLFTLSYAFVCLFLGIKTLKEINLAFLPFESRAFTLDDPDAFEDYYSQLGRRREELYATFADQLATVCSLLGEYPSVRAWK